MPKPIDISLKFGVPNGGKIKKASISPEGDLVLLDENGNLIIPEEMIRTISYPRERKNSKIQSRSSTSNSYLSINGLKELTQYESVFVIDTNTKIINGKKISIACFISCKFIPIESQFTIECESRLHFYEFHNIPDKENPEKLAILKVANDVSKSIDWDNKHKFIFVTDSDIQAHDKITKREVPIYKNQYLPEGFSLNYASTDTGSETIHRLIRFCDKQASEFFNRITNNEIKSELKPLKEDNSVLYNYIFRTDLEIVNPTVDGLSIPPGAKFSIYGIKE